MRKIILPLMGLALMTLVTIVVLTTGTVTAAAKRAPRTEGSSGDSAASQSASEDPNTVWIGMHDKGKSCEAGSGIDMDAMGVSLRKKGVRILEKKKVHDGMMRIQQCGVDNGNMNGFLIPIEDLSKATDLGFERLRQ